MYLPRGGAAVNLLTSMRACVVWSATDAAFSRASLLAACAQDKPLHSVGYKVVCSGQAFAHCGLQRGHMVSLPLWVKVIPQPVLSVFEMIAWPLAGERTRVNKWRIATLIHGR